jgi:hypothetical protein
MGKEELLMALLDDGPQAVTGQERERVFEEMQHLDLKPGDKVSWISGEYCDAKFPAVDEVAEVFRVFPIVTRAHDGSNHDADEHDFFHSHEKERDILRIRFRQPPLQARRIDSPARCSPRRKAAGQSKRRTS